MSGCLPQSPSELPNHFDANCANRLLASGFSPPRMWMPFPQGRGSIKGDPDFRNRRLDAGGRRDVSALLRQPDGFEGLGGVEVFANAGCLAVLEVDEPGDGSFGLRSTFPATPTELTDANDSLAKVSDFRHLDVRFCEDFIDVSVELANALVSPVHRRLAPEQNLQERVPLDFGIDFPQKCVDVSTVECVGGPPYRFDVLRRHSPTPRGRQLRGLRPDPCSCECGRSCLSAALPPW